MCEARRPRRRRKGFTLIELLVVMALILVLFALGVGYIVFGQDNQHSVTAANAVTGAMLNARQRARRDGLPTGIRLLFGTNGLTATQCGQVELVQQPDDYTAGQMNNVLANSTQVTFTGVDFQGGAAYMGQIDESTVQAGDYFTTPASPTPHRINTVAGVVGGVQTLTLDSPVGPFPPGTPYAIVRGPRRLPSEDLISLPPSIVIDDRTFGGTALCQNLPQRILVDSNNPAGVPVSEIVFASSGAMIGQGSTADKVLLWLRDPTQATPLGAAPLIISVQVRTGLINVYPVAPWNTAQPISLTNDPYLYAKDGRASGS